MQSSVLNRLVTCFRTECKCRSVCWDSHRKAVVLAVTISPAAHQLPLPPAHPFLYPNHCLNMLILKGIFLNAKKSNVKLYIHSINIYQLLIMDQILLIIRNNMGSMVDEAPILHHFQSGEERKVSKTLT